MNLFQPGLTTGSRRFAKRLGSSLFPGLVPAADRLPVNSQTPGDLALMNTSVKKPGGPEASPFQFIKIPFNAFWITHAPSLAQKIRAVTILCEIQ